MVNPLTLLVQTNYFLRKNSKGIRLTEREAVRGRSIVEQVYSLLNCITPELKPV